MHEKKLKNNRLKIIIVLLLIIFIVGGYFLTRFIYNLGVSAGRTELKEKYEENLTSLGALVLEKSELSMNVSETLSDFPDEADVSDFENYSEKISDLILKTKPDVLKTRLEDFKTKLDDFIEFYDASENNSEISESYSEIKISASELSRSLNGYYNEKIESLLKTLGE